MGPQGTVPGGTSRVLAFQPRPTILHRTPQETNSPILSTAPGRGDSPWRANPNSAWPSSAWASGPSSSRSTRTIPTPTSSPSAGARRKELNECGDRWVIGKRYTNFEDVLDDPNIDAVHINSPIPDHAWQSIAALKAGKHVACTVPMATSIEDCRQIVEAQRRSGKVYMMMETVVYSREYLFVKDLYDNGELGPHPVPARLAPAGHGRLARLLGGPAADALRHALREPLPGPGRQARRARRLPRLRPDRRRADLQVRLPVRRRDRHDQAPRQRRLRPR